MGVEYEKGRQFFDKTIDEGSENAALNLWSQVLKIESSLREPGMNLESLLLENEIN